MKSNIFVAWGLIISQIVGFLVQRSAYEMQWNDGFMGIVALTAIVFIAAALVIIFQLPDPKPVKNTQLATVGLIAAVAISFVLQQSAGYPVSDGMAVAILLVGLARFVFLIWVVVILFKLAKK